MAYHDRPGNWVTPDTGQLDFLLRSDHRQRGTARAECVGSYLRPRAHRWRRQAAHEHKPLHWTNSSVPRGRPVCVHCRIEANSIFRFPCRQILPPAGIGPDSLITKASGKVLAGKLPVHPRVWPSFGGPSSPKIPRGADRWGLLHLSRNPYTRGHHLGRGSRQPKKNLMSQAIGHEFPLCGHRTWPIVMHT
jgi:hypothetical protein